MGVSFANPAAVWALLGIPAILILHLLQSRNRRVRISTLFLIEPLQQDTRKGAVFSRIRNGWQLWLQVLAVVLFALLLARPQRIREESVQLVAVVVDSSRSMNAFREDVRKMLQTLTQDLSRTAAATRWWVLPSEETLPRWSVSEGPESISPLAEDFRFLSGPHDPSARLQEARQIVGPEGTVVFLTDHTGQQISRDVIRVSVGSALPNAALTRPLFPVSPEGQKAWRISVVNYSDEVMERDLLVEREGQVLSRQPFRLQPGGIQTLEGRISQDVQSGLFRLDPEDGVPSDDRQPFVVPEPKPLRVTTSLRGEAELEWISRLITTVPGAVAVTSSAADVTLQVSVVPAASSELQGVVAFRKGDAPLPYARILAEPHPLVDDLPWDDLLVQPAGPFALQPTDRVLLRMGETPLAVLRQREQGSALMLNLDPTTGNVTRNASLALLLHRYFRRIQQVVPMPEFTNLITRQPVSLPQAEYEFTTGEGRTVPFDPSTGNSPAEPGWLRGTRGDEVFYWAGVGESDLSESDFRKSEPAAWTPSEVRNLQSRHVSRDFLLPLWVLLLGIALVGSWAVDPSGGKRA